MGICASKVLNMTIFVSLRIAYTITFEVFHLSAELCVISFVFSFCFSFFAHSFSPLFHSFAHHLTLHSLQSLFFCQLDS